MTVFDFVMTLTANLENIDMNDTHFVIRTPDGDYTPGMFELDEDIDGRDGLVLYVLETED